MDALKLSTVLGTDTGWYEAVKKKEKKKKRGRNSRAETDVTKHEEIHK